MSPNPNADAGGEMPESAQAAAVSILAQFHQWREETGPCPIGVIGPWANKLAHLCERLASTQQALAEARRELVAVRAALNCDLPGKEDAETVARKMYHENCDLRTQLATSQALLAEARRELDFQRTLTKEAEEREVKLATQLADAQRVAAAQLEELTAISTILGTSEGHSSVDHIQALQTKLATLRQQNEALRRDGERIDKLERTCLFTQPHMSPSYLKGTVAIDILTRHGNLRAAIDDVLPRDNINITRAAQQAEGKP